MLSPKVHGRRIKNKSEIISHTTVFILLLLFKLRNESSLLYRRVIREGTFLAVCKSKRRVRNVDATANPSETSIPHSAQVDDCYIVSSPIK